MAQRFGKTRIVSLSLLLILWAWLGLPLNVLGDDEVQPNPASSAPQSNSQEPDLGLAQAVMCEKVQNLKPVNEAITFSVTLGQVYCFTAFKPVTKPDVIYHRWFNRQELSTQIKLKVYPPFWSTYSMIQLREEDKGPWQVEITDQSGKVLDVLRFSITD